MESRGSAFIAALSKYRRIFAWPRDAVRCSGVFPWESLYRAEAPCSNRADTQPSLPNMACRGSTRHIMGEENMLNVQNCVKEEFPDLHGCMHFRTTGDVHTCTSNTLTALCNAVKPFLSAASAFAPFSNRIWTQSVWQPRAASMRAVLQVTKNENKHAVMIIHTSCFTGGRNLNAPWVFFIHILFRILFRYENNIE